MKYQDELKWIIPLAAVCFLLFANTIGGEFVYDDVRQILRNPLIQDNSLIWQALTSDVWAFKGDGKIVASNYWRPTFTAWHILNFRLFGANPVGWHVLNIFLHTGVCLLAYGLVRRWGFSAVAAFCVSLILAIHPTRVESVAWISGSPDLLFGLAFFASLWFAMNDAEDKKSSKKGFLTVNLIVAIVFYAIALGAKEIGILCLPIYYLIYRGETAEKQKNNDFFKEILVYLAVGGIYFIARFNVIGALSRPPEDAVGLGTAILSIPAIFAFYLRQIFFPVWLSANYPLQPVAEIGLLNFFVPLAVLAVFAVGFYYLAGKTKYGKLAVLLFLLPLLPAMNSTAFIPDQIVHDRYLYVPLLGVLMLIVPFVEGYLKEKNTVILFAVLGLGLAFQTFSYNRAWLNELDLWSWSVKNDDSAFSAAQYGSELLEKGRFDEAIRAYTDSLQKRPQLRSYYGRGRSFLGKKQFAEAEKDFLKILENSLENKEGYLLYQTFESLAICYLEQKNFDEALKRLDEGRRALPIYTASLTAKKAVVLYQQDRKNEALKELEAVKEKSRQELLPEAKTVFLRLGMLYAELGRKEEAKSHLQEYLKLTEKFTDTSTLRERPQALNLLKKL